jgi:uncharacterized repeat protein (TIGR03943 family)
VVAAVTAAGGLISVLAGTVLLRLAITGIYGRYVRVGMGPLLVAAGVAMVVLGLVTLVRSLRRGGDAGAAEAEAGEHDHGRGAGRVGWLLLAPIAALLLVAPPTLGSYGVDRGAKVDVRAGASAFAPLAQDAAPVPMTLLEFSQRAFDRDGASFNRTSVRLTGFVAGAGPGGEPGGFRLARYQIACCAADAAPVVVRVRVDGAGTVPPLDRWVTVTGLHSPSSGEVAELTATSIVEIRAPDDPYE